MKLEDLNLTQIDGMRHLVVSEDVVEAVGLAIRAGYGSTTAYRFVTALVMLDQLNKRGRWGEILRAVRRMEL